MALEPAVSQVITATPSPIFVLVPPNATPTPTPFQPLPPTPLFSSTEIPFPTETPSQSPTPLVTLPSELPTQQPVAQVPSQINVLLLGADARPWDSSFRTDTIILLTLNSALGRVNLTSFPRDLYVNIPGWGMGRINSAWTYGGYNLLVKTLKNNFGIQPDYFVLINFSSFKRIVDSLGGLTVHVGEPLSDYRYGYWVSIPAGDVHMDADTVLWYVRSRKTTSDFARNRRQQEVLQAIFEKLISLDAVRRASEFYDLYRDNVKTDAKFEDILPWLPLALQVAETKNIHHFYISGDNVTNWITPEGAMVLLPNQESIMRVIRKSQNIR